MEHLSLVTGYAVATAAELRANTPAGKLVPLDQLWSAHGLVSLTDAATIAVDFSLGFNFQVTLAGSRTLGNPTNVKVGQSGIIIVTQDGTGNRILSFAANWEFPGNGAIPVLSTGAGEKDALHYFVQSSTSILIEGFLKDFA